MKMLASIKDHGYRLTKPRQEIVNVLNKFPQSAQEIFASLQKKKVHIDLSSIYRSLELFVEMGLVRVIDIGEKERSYELADEKNHHHHLICNHCGIIQDIKLNEKQIMKDIKQKSTFKLDHHHLEFFGLCTNCQ